MNPKTAEKIQNEIYRKMPGAKKLRLSLKINDRIFKIAKKKTKSQYPNLDPISFSKEVYEHFDLKREFYDNLFSRFIKEELIKQNLI